MVYGINTSLIHLYVRKHSDPSGNQGQVYSVNPGPKKGKLYVSHLWNKPEMLKLPVHLNQTNITVFCSFPINNLLILALSILPQKVL